MTGLYFFKQRRWGYRPRSGAQRAWRAGDQRGQRRVPPSRHPERHAASARHGLMLTGTFTGLLETSQFVHVVKASVFGVRGREFGAGRADRSERHLRAAPDAGGSTDRGHLSRRWPRFLACLSGFMPRRGKFRRQHRRWPHVDSASDARGGPRTSPAVGESSLAPGPERAVGRVLHSRRCRQLVGHRAIQGGCLRVPGDPAVVIAPKQTQARPCDTDAVVELGRLPASDGGRAT